MAISAYILKIVKIDPFFRLKAESCGVHMNLKLSQNEYTYCTNSNTQVRYVGLCMHSRLT